MDLWTLLLPLACRWAEGASASPTITAMGGGERVQGVAVSSSFDSGNIDIVSVSQPAEHGAHVVDVQIHPDPYCDSDRKEHFQLRASS